MTATVLYQTDTADPVTTPITFILAGNRLITLRYAEPRAFSIFSARCAKPDPSLTNGTAVLIGLIETIVDRMADFIERIQGEVDKLSRSIFDMKGGSGTRQRRRIAEGDRARRRADLPRQREHAFPRAPADLPHPGRE